MGNYANDVFEQEFSPSNGIGLRKWVIDQDGDIVEEFKGLTENYDLVEILDQMN